MKKRDNERRHKHLLEKDYLKALMTDISMRFDFNKQSWITETIVNKVNHVIETFEKEKGIERVRPGEIVIPYKKKLLAIPLFDQEALHILVDTKMFATYKKRMIKKTLQLLKSFDKNVTVEEVYSLISPRDSIPRYQQDPAINDAQIDVSCPLLNPDDIEVKLSKITPFIPPLSEEIKNDIIHFCVHEVGMKPLMANSLLNYFLERRALFLPLISSVQPGQLNWLGTSFKKARKIGCVQIARQQTPIILTLYTKEEIEKRPANLSELNKLMMKQLARITTEAYLQETLLPGDELQLFYLRSYTVIGKLLRKYMQIHKVILPTPGTILDSGTTLTHKELVIDLHMQGYYTKEIARKTYHDPRSVDAYLRTFNAILILWYYGLPKTLISMVTERGQKVVQQHIDIIVKYFPDNDSMKNYLIKQEIAI
ncbi:MAG: DUF1670 domain-containing protein [Deltaproteobacteria bacterium]|nr:DUF1670 domain-containing protein [Deltaproteobacteria bacterium]